MKVNTREFVLIASFCFLKSAQRYKYLKEKFMAEDLATESHRNSRKKPVCVSE